TFEEKNTRKIDRLARYLLIQGLLNDIYSVINSNETAKDLWDALGRQMRGSEYGEQDRKSAILYEYETFKAIEGEQLLDTYLRYLQVINGLKKCGYKKDNCELNYKFLNNLEPQWKQYGTLMRQTKNLLEINIDALYNILKQNQGDVNDALGYKKKAIVAFNRRKFYSKPTNNNLRTSSTSQSANKKQEFVKTDDKKVEKKDDEKKRDMSKVNCYNCNKEGHFAKDYKKAKVKDYNYYKIKMLIAKKDSDEYMLLAEDQAWMESNSDSYWEINANMVFMAHIEKVLSESDESSSSAEETITEKCIEKANQQTKDLKNQNKDLQEKYDVLINQVNTFEEQNNEFNEQIKVLNKKNADSLAQTEVLHDQLKFKHVVIDTHTECQAQYAKLEEEKYEYMIRYFSLCDNDKQHRKKIDEYEILFDKMSRHNKTAKDLWDALARKMLGSEYGEQDRKAVVLYEYETFKTTEGELLLDTYIRLKKKTVVLTSDPLALIAEKTKQTSSLKPYVPSVILEKIIIDLEDEVIRLLEKEKANLETIKSLKSKGFESSENAISELENQSENDCLVVEKECDQMENSKTSSVYVCNDAMNVSCNSRMCDLFDENNLFIFDDESVRISPVSKMPFRKKFRDSMNIVQICIWIINSECSKHMTGNRALLTNFVEKFLGTVGFGNNDFAVIAGYGDVVIGSMTIKKVYYVEDGVDLLTSDRSSNWNTISLNEVASNSLTYLLAKASSSQSWLWHQRHSHLNFATINKLVKNNLVQGLPKMKFEKDRLCSACEQGKIHRKHHKSKMAFASNKPLYLLYMDLCGPMRVKNEASEVIISFIKKTYVNLQLHVLRVQTDNCMEFKNKTLAKYFDEIHESVNVNFDEISEMASKQFSLELDLSNLNEKGKSLNPLVSQVSETSKKDLEDLIHNFYDEYFDSSKIMKSSTTNVETSNVEIPSHEEEVFHESSELFQEESSSSLLNDDVQQSPEEVILPSSNTQSISNNMIPNVDEANEALRDADWVSAMQEELDQFIESLEISSSTQRQNYNQNQMDLQE
nr:hypothetical protein [Tanacetum cinerariifolium]